MATKNPNHDLQQTNGTFQFRGIVNGTTKEGFYKEITTKSNKPMRMANFGIEYDKDKRSFISLNGMVKEKVHFSKQTEKDGKKTTDVKPVDWSDRFNFNEEGYNLIGVRLGLEKITDDNGKTANKKETLSEYDACGTIGTNLNDGQSVFIKGKIEYSTYKEKHQSKFVPQQISLCSSDIDFEDEKFESVNNFTQQIVYMGIAKDKECKDRDKFIISAKIIGYSSIEDFEFVTYHAKLANNLKKLKPYTAITVYGDIETVTSVEEVEDEDDGWGESNKMERVNQPFVQELVVTGADKDSIDTELYSEESVESAIAKLASKDKANNDFGSTDDDDWGSASTKAVNDEDEDEWD